MATIRVFENSVLAPRDRRNADGLSAHGLATARGRLPRAPLSRLIDNPRPLDDAQRFAAHLAIEFPALFTLLCDPLVHDVARPEPIVPDAFGLPPAVGIPAAPQ